MSDAPERMPLSLPAEIWASVTQITENFGGAFWRPRPFPAGVHHAEGVRYVRGDIADANKRQRDKLLEAARDAYWLLSPNGMVATIEAAQTVQEKLSAAIAECEGEPGTRTNTPRTLVPGAPHPPKNDDKSGG